MVRVVKGKKGKKKKKEKEQEGRKVREPNCNRTNEMTLSAQINLHRETRRAILSREISRGGLPPVLGRTRELCVPRIGPALPLTRSTASDDNEFRFSLVGQTRRIRRLGCYRLTRPRLAALARPLARIE